MINLGLENKKVIILGASNGIGKQLSYDFVNQGSKVSIVARNLRSLKKIASNLNSIKPGNNFFSIDLMPEGNPTKIIKKIFNLHGVHEIIINCVGGGMGVNNPPKKYNDWNKVWRFNCGIAIESNMEAIKHLEKQKTKFARFIHISSYAGKLAKPTHNKIAYSTSKAFLNSYIKNMSKHYGNKNLIFNGIMPGPILTKGKFWKKKIKKNPKEVRKYLKENFSLNRFAKYSEITPYILALASEYTSYTSGSIIDLSGGEID